VIRLTSRSTKETSRMASNKLVGNMERPTEKSQSFDGHENFTIGIIGLGDMGKMYAMRLSDAGWR